MSMKARGALMVEHRVIERMIGLMNSALARIEATHDIEPLFVSAVLDFVRTYADRTHHGKEEDILFRDLAKKDMSVEHRRLMERLLEEHVIGRDATKALAEACARYCSGDLSALAGIAHKLKTLVDLYPQHIANEDKVFFPASHTYLTDEEEQAMLAEFWEFDRTMIHEKYKAVVAGLGG